jgi:hypothetical protein
MAVFLVARLFRTWTAAYFAPTNFAWFRCRSLEVLNRWLWPLPWGAFWVFRRRRIFVALWLGSLAVTVRRLIIFVLVGIVILYVLPLAIYFGDVLLTVRRYLSRDHGAANATGPHGHLFGWPFHGIVLGTMIYPAPWTNLVLSFFRMFAVLAGTGMMFSARFRAYLKTYPQEAYFAAFISSRYFAATI